MIELSEAAQLLLANDNIEILTHHYPDGDTLGAGYGLCLMLQSLGKCARVVTSGEVAAKYSFLKRIVKPQDFSCGYVVSVDVAAPSLLGENREKYESIIDLCIDHHETNSIDARYKFVDDTAAATCEIIYELAALLKARITPEVANCIYTGVSTDTGCFRYTNTTVRTHFIAAKMMERGAAWQDINTEMFEVKSRAKLELERMVYDTLEFCADGKCAMIYTTLKMQKKSRIGDDEVEGLASIPRQVEGVLIGITMREKADGTFKISVRTNRDVNASEFCAQFGGGGHAAAAGCTIEGDLKHVKLLLKTAAEQTLL